MLTRKIFNYVSKMLQKYENRGQCDGDARSRRLVGIPTKRNDFGQDRRTGAIIWVGFPETITIASSIHLCDDGYP
jgi:hypothetical protein